MGFDPLRAGRLIEGVRAHWLSLRHGRLVPDRVDICAASLGPALDHAFILERIAPGAARLRLAGRHLIDLMGMEVRGMPFCALFHPPSRGRVSDMLEAVFRGPQLADLVLGARIDGRGGSGDGRMLLMPLKSDLGDVTRALGCLVADIGLGRPPRRLDLLGEDCEALLPAAGPAAAARRPEPQSTPPPLLRILPRPTVEAETGPRRRRFRGFGADGADTGAPRDPEQGERPPWHPRLIIDNS